MLTHAARTKGSGQSKVKILPNQVLTHAARAAAKQLNFRHLWWPRAKGSKTISKKELELLAAAMCYIYL